MTRVTNSFIVWGGGGHGRVVADALRAAGANLVGILDAAPKQVDSKLWGDDIRVFDEGALQDGTHLSGAAGAVALGIGDNQIRWACARRVGDEKLATAIHPDATVSPSAHVFPGAVVLAGAVVNANARIGRAAVVNTGAIVEHDCVLGDGAHVGPGAVLCGGVVVGHCGFVGANATVLPLVTIGDHTTVGAGATVVNDIGSREIVVGTPARPLARNA